MDKILDGEFRNTLYKNLVDAGYQKKEAQKIIGVKYHDALRDDLRKRLAVLSTLVESETYDSLVFNGEELNAIVDELKKVKGVIE